MALSEHVNCYSVDMIKIGNRVTVSREVFLCCASHDIASSNMELVHAPIIIDDDAWVAARAIVLHGRTIGEEPLWPQVQSLFMTSPVDHCWGTRRCRFYHREIMS